MMSATVGMKAKKLLIHHPSLIIHRFVFVLLAGRSRGVMKRVFARRAGRRLRAAIIRQTLCAPLIIKRGAARDKEQATFPCAARVMCRRVFP